MTEHFVTNAAGWDARTPAHIGSEFYDVAGFLNGNCTLKSLEVELLGNVRAQRLLHLQCHFGLDTLSWARRGAVVTGVDFSQRAIEAARLLSERTGLEAEFLHRDVQELGELSGQFDVAVTSYGVLCWLGRLDDWAEGVYRNLRPGGRFVMVEFHPILDVLGDGCLSGRSTYFGNGPVVTEAVGTYADQSAELRYSQVRWQHTLADIFGALIRAGFVVRGFKEHPFCSYRIVPALDHFDGEFWRCVAASDTAPFMFSLDVVRPR